MKTLKELALMVVIQFGLGYGEVLPPNIYEEMLSVEDEIRRKMTGYEYYEYYRVKHCLEFDISWHRGTWTFVQRGLFEDDDYDQRRVCIRAGKEIFLSWVWSSVFVLENYVPGGTCFIVSGFQLDLSTRRVMFYGYYYCQDSGQRRSFESTFWFSQTGFYVRVTTQQKLREEHYLNWESCFQKPDPDGWREHWDNQFHDPPFIKAVRDFLFDD